MTEPVGPRVERLGERSRNPHRLGRHVQHDPQSLRFAAPVLPRRAIASVRWTRRVDVWDQASSSSCVGQTFAGWVATDHTARTGLTSVGDTLIDQVWARDVVYHWCTEFDQFPGAWPPLDTGSSGLGGAKALQHLGLISGYRHGFTPAAAYTALQVGSVPTGTIWFGSMFEPAADGRVTVDPASGDAGGHEYLLDELDVERGRVWFQNSWSASWGREGRAWFTLDDYAALLARDGDITIPIPVAEPAEPTPARPGGCLPRILGPLGFGRSRSR